MSPNPREIASKPAESAPENSDPIATLQLGVAHHREGRLDQADALYRLVLETSPEQPDALHLLGLLRFHQGNPDEADVLISRAIALQAKNPAYFSNHALALTALGRTEDALAAYDKALALDPNTATALDGKGTLLRHLGRMDEALQMLARAVDCAPLVPETHTNLGNTFQAAGKLYEAISCYERALHVDPKFAAAHGNLALALFLSGDPDNAVVHYRDALAQNDEAAEMHLGLGWALFGTAYQEEAKACFERALTLQPDLAEAHVKLALSLLAEDDVEAAHRHLVRSAELFAAPPRTTARFKLRHDAEQLARLLKKGAIEDANRTIARRLNRAMRAIPAGIADDQVLPLTPEQVAQLELTQCLPRYQPPIQLRQSSVLNPDFDREAIEAAYFSANPNVVTIDKILSDEALDAVREFCWDATIWNDVKVGYLGAYIKEGFSSPLLLQIAAQIRAGLPNLLGEHPLIEMWAYKYDQELLGIETHADCAAVNLNFWIAPDDANLDPETGGLVLYTKEAPLSWDFRRYNNQRDDIENFLDESGRDFVRVAHRPNRAVLFNSNLFHKTDEFSFKPGYENRRINITLLYGHRANVKR